MASESGGSPIDAYLAALPEAQRLTLQDLRETILAVVPGATECISYQVPTIRWHGNLVHFAAFKNHCSFFPGSSRTLGRYGQELAGYTTAKGTVRFTPERPIPRDVVRRIVEDRVAENEAKAKA